MAEKIKGTVKWFSNKKGYGFIAPSDGSDDIFVHQSNIITAAEYRTLRKGAEVEFESMTDESGKLRARDVTYPGGVPCPAPEFGGRRARGPGNGGGRSDTDDADDAEGDATEETGGPKRTNTRNRNRNNNRKKADRSGDDAGSNDGAAETDGKVGEESKRKPRPKPEWYTNLNEEVQKSIDERKIGVGSGRTFVKTSDSRIKLGSGGYASLGHSKGVLAEGTYEVAPDGTVTFTWEHVLSVDTSGETPEWKDTSADTDQEGLISSLSLADDSVQPTEMYEEITGVWGDDKGDPTPMLEDAGFLMRKVSLAPNTRDKPGRGGGGGRGRGRFRNKGRRDANKGGDQGNEAAAGAATGE